MKVVKRLRNALSVSTQKATSKFGARTTKVAFFRFCWHNDDTKMKLKAIIAKNAHQRLWLTSNWNN